MPFTRSRAVELIREYLESSPHRKIARQLQQCAGMVLGDENVSAPGADESYLGGYPHLPCDADWPVWDRTQAVQSALPAVRQQAESSESTWYREYIAELESMLEQPVVPLSFLGQIVMEEVHEACVVPYLPKTGVMQFFYGMDAHQHEFDPCDRSCFRVIYHPRGTSLRAVEPPSALSGDRQAAAHRVSFKAFWSLPHWFSASCLVSEERDEGEYESYIELLDHLQHFGMDEALSAGQIGGWPPLIQGDMYLDCQLASHGIDPKVRYESKPDPRIRALAKGAGDWRLIMHLDSERELDWCWGDAGYLYFWAREKEISRGDLTSAWCTMQCS